MAYIRFGTLREMVTAIGRRVKDLRISRHQTQEDLALAAGISVRTL
jgi:DNA-binding XRE family transcriptional regulator